MIEKTDFGPPDFIGIGVQRAGTSWLYRCLEEHTEIFLPRKEVGFFNSKFDRGIEWYYSLFNKDGGCRIAGEFTPDYIFDDFSIKAIAEHCPDSKLIVILRDPFDSAFSAYSLYLSHGKYECMSFKDAIEKDPFIVEQSMYFSQLTNLFSSMPREQIKIYDFEDISDRPLWLLNDLFNFLEVDSTFIPRQAHEKFNISSMSGLQSAFKLPMIQKKMSNNIIGRRILELKKTRLVRAIKTRVWERKNTFDAKLKSVHCPIEIRQLFKEDLIKTSKLLNRNYEK